MVLSTSNLVERALAGRRPGREFGPYPTKGVGGPVQGSQSIGPASSKLESFGDDLFSEFERSGAGGIERDVIRDAGPRTGEDVQRIGSEAGDLASRSFDTARGTLERQRRALGTNMTDRERRSSQRRLGLAKVLANVDARNRAFDADQSRREATRTSAGGLRDLIDQTALTGLSAGAQAETSREIDFMQRKARHEQEQAAGLGTLAGIGMSFIPGGALFAPAVGKAVAGAAA